MAKTRRFQVKGDLNDLGFGSKVSQEISNRFLNRDGSFNVQRRGLSFLRSLSMYHALLTMSWWRFHLVVACAFVTANAVFAAGYVLSGPAVLSGAGATSLADRLLNAFFFSVQTFTTVGYGQLVPQGFVANVLATLDVFAGLMGFALATGLVFARFSRPTAKIMFSRSAVIAPYGDGRGLMFRIANERSSQLIHVEVKVLFARLVQNGARRQRRFDELSLERRQVEFFPLHWTIVHPIDANSPLHGLRAEDLQESDAEFLVLLLAFDETFAQTVHSRSSYKYHELIWNAKFSNILQHQDDGRLAVDLHRLSDIERLGS